MLQASGGEPTRRVTNMARLWKFNGTRKTKIVKKYAIHKMLLVKILMKKY